MENIAHTIDLNFMGLSGTIASYLLPHRDGALLVECGPGSTIPALVKGLDSFGLSVKDISSVFLTHIHLDHAGAAGWLARQGARIYVHPVGAPHMLDPEKLLGSARRIYGDSMQTLWGDFLPVPEEQLTILQDGEVVEVGGVCIRALDTPGHADHHFVYLSADTCFSGDIGGVRLAGPPHLRLPMPPPEFHLEKWRASLHRLQKEKFGRLAPTHFGIFTDPGWHLAALSEALDEVESWMEAVMPSDPPFDDLNDEFIIWSRHRSLSAGLQGELLKYYEAANPSWMSTYGIQRYWRKYRSEATA
jgi:glyoxylase-like metal-dependent hydrolase (beta-lactamase superfamily II)